MSASWVQRKLPRKIGRTGIPRPRPNGWPRQSNSGKPPTVMIQLPPEFKRLLNSFNSIGVEYVVVGGYAVIYHGYVRTTGGLDLWISLTAANADKAVAAIRSLGFNPPWLKGPILLKKGAVLRIGTAPFRFDILNDISGVNFKDCFERRIQAEVDGITVNFIGLSDLKANKRAAGRNKDLADLDYLP
jgi:predicted nucleotidyltransferase